MPFSNCLLEQIWPLKLPQLQTGWRPRSRVLGQQKGDTGTHLESPEITDLLAEIEVELCDQKPILITGEAGGPAAVGSCHVARTIEVAKVMVSFKGQREVAMRVGSEEGQVGTLPAGYPGESIRGHPVSANFLSPFLRPKGPREGGRVLLSHLLLSPAPRTCVDVTLDVG